MAGRVVPHESDAILYLAGTLPARSETFIAREIRALRAAGRTIRCATLHASTSVPDDADDLLDGLITVYAPGWWRTSIVAAMASPIRTARTLLVALADMLAPGETTSMSTRARLLPQALAGIALSRRLPDDVEHIHAHFAHAPTTVAMYAAEHRGVRFSFTGHANDIFERRSLLKKKLRRAAFVSSISEWHREMYLRAAPATRRTPVIRCGVDTDEWSPNESSTSATDGEFVVLTVCRLVEKKGIHVLVAAIATVPDACLVIAGDGPERERLEALAASHGIADRVTFLGAVENHEVRSLLTTADCFALPCQEDRNGDRDGIPVVLMEAMAAGVPVIAGDLPAIRELVVDGETGWLIPGIDIGAWGSRLAALASAPAPRVAAAGRQRVIDEFSMSVNRDRLSEQFEQLGIAA